MVTRWSFAENCEVDLDPSDYMDIDYDDEDDDVLAFEAAKKHMERFGHDV